MILCKIIHYKPYFYYLNYLYHLFIGTFYFFYKTIVLAIFLKCMNVKLNNFMVKKAIFFLELNVIQVSLIILNIYEYKYSTIIQSPFSVSNERLTKCLIVGLP